VPRLVTTTREKKQLQLVMFSGDARAARFLARRSWQAERGFPWFVVTIAAVKDASDARQERLAISEVAVRDRDAMLAAVEANALGALRQDESGARSEVVGEPADRIELEYLQPAFADKPEQWQSDWDLAGHDRLPRAVRVNFTRGKDVQTATFLVPMQREFPEGR